MSISGKKIADWISDTEKHYIVFDEGEILKGYPHLSTGDKITIKPDGKILFKSKTLSNTSTSASRSEYYSGGGDGDLMEIAGKIKINLKAIYITPSGNETYDAQRVSAQLFLEEPIVINDIVAGARNTSVVSNNNFFYNKNLTLLESNHHPSYNLRILFEEIASTKYPEINKALNTDKKYVDDRLEVAWNIIFEAYSKERIRLF